MSKIDVDSIRDTAEWLSGQSVSSNADSSSPITKRDLENLKHNVVKAILAIADALDD